MQGIFFNQEALGSDFHNTRPDAWTHWGTEEKEQAFGQKVFNAHLQIKPLGPHVGTAI